MADGETKEEKRAKEPPPPPLAERIRVGFRDSVATTRLVIGTHRGYAAATVALSLVSALLPAAIAWAGRELIDAIVRAVDGDATAAAILDARHDALVWVGIELGLVILFDATRRTTAVVGQLQRALVAERFNELILERALEMSISDFEDSKTYDQMTKARREASYRPIDHVAQILSLGQELVTLLSLSALLWAISPWAVLVLTAGAIPSFVAQTKFDQEAFRLFSWKAPETRKQNYLEMVIARADHAKEVKLFGVGPLFLDRYKKLFADLWEKDKSLAIRSGIWGLALGAVGTVAFYGLYAWVAWRAANGTISVSDMTMCVLVFRRGQEAVHGLLSSGTALPRDQRYLRALFEVLDRPPARPAGGATVGTKPGDGVRFENVEFSYPDAKEPALRDLNLHLPARHKLALVGENGAGKTTLIKLLTRLYKPTKGRILLDGLDLEDWDEIALRDRIGVIFQDFVQYQILVGENIGVGDVRAIDDEGRWNDAAEKGMANEVIGALPKGMKTQLGKWFDDGRELSLGQWQKIALSRAFMRKDADILVLDEPTASMDAEAEAKVFARFRALTSDKTAVLISHRFSTVRIADRIAVLHHGEVVELGSHEELTARGGRYASLFALQAKGYQ